MGIGHHPRQKTTTPRAEHGFTLIELLVVILIIGILAAIAIPSFLSQGNKAQDAQAKSMVRVAEWAMETYSTDHGSYSGASVSALNSIEPTLISSSTSQAYLSAVSATSNTYTVTAVNPVTSDAFVISQTSGTTSRTCTTAGKGGCPSAGTW
jgi:type IV pilus assembly protein PilA